MVRPRATTWSAIRRGTRNDAAMSDEARPTALPQLPEALPDVISTTLDALVKRGIEGVGPLKPAHVVADEHVAASTSKDEAVARLIRTHTRLAGASGFVTGLGGVAALPIALPAGVGGLYLIGSRMTAGIAHVRGYDVSSDEVRSAIAVCLLGAAGSEAVKKVGVNASRRFLVASLRRMPASPLLAVNRAVGFRLLTKSGTTGIVNLSRAIPFVGGPVSSAVDIAVCRAIARYARRTFVAIDRGGPQ